MLCCSGESYRAIMALLLIYGKALQFYMVIRSFFSQSGFLLRVHVTSPLSSCGCKQKRNFLTGTGYMNIPALCASEQFHEILHKVYWTRSAGLRNCF